MKRAEASLEESSGSVKKAKEDEGYSRQSLTKEDSRVCVEKV
jgi:hypothetical protein